VQDKVKPIAWTDPIPNDTWSTSPACLAAASTERPCLPADLKAKITDRLLRIAQTTEGKDALKGLYEIEGLTSTVELTDAQVQQLGIQFSPDIADRITRKGTKVAIPVGDWYFQSIRDAARLLGLDLQKLAR
jgi:ABC-type phosphate/phosphonate transport system substrate-binding protein